MNISHGVDVVCFSESLNHVGGRGGKYCFGEVGAKDISKPDESVSELVAELREVVVFRLWYVGPVNVLDEVFGAVDLEKEGESSLIRLNGGPLNNVLNEPWHLGQSVSEVDGL